jgi:hypothetical protein
VRRLVVLTVIRLDFDDPPDASARGVVTDEVRTEDGPGGLDRPAPEGRPVDGAQRG